ncbi:MAG TPA: SDR family NAD(P)-dependent oxidoreductase [Nannocystaceae bacterium]|nr:SDR family NAD(P)-dependent oxidoreductase [Nannocystaceae bacterium]
MKIAIVGATKGMGRALARELAARGDALCLLGRDTEELAKSAEDLRVRGPSAKVSTAHCDFEQPESFGDVVTEAEAQLGGLEAVIVTAGMFGTQDALEADAQLLQRVLAVDFTNTVLFCEAARKQLLARGGGTLCVFSSVAGERGRKPVVLYGAAKAGVSAYLEGLDHRFHAQGLRVVCVKPGFVKTGMTAGLRPPPFAGEPEAVAKAVVRALDRGKPVVYAPGIWRWIMMVIRMLPRFLMRRIGF